MAPSATFRPCGGGGRPTRPGTAAGLSALPPSRPTRRDSRESRDGCSRPRPAGRGLRRSCQETVVMRNARRHQDVPRRPAFQGDRLARRPSPDPPRTTRPGTARRMPRGPLAGSTLPPPPDPAPRRSPTWRCGKPTPPRTPSSSARRALPIITPGHGAPTDRRLMAIVREGGNCEEIPYRA